MAMRRFSAEIADRADAYAVAGLVENLLEPPPDALTVFENPGKPWRVEVYFDDDAGERDLNGELAVLGRSDLPAFVSEPVPDLNWVALSQAALPPVHAGRFTVHGSHDSHRVPRGPNAILIDAGEAFGTAHHATTLGCLEAIDRLSRQRSFGDVLDLGCGSGVLAIAAAKAMPAARIVASDLDQRSVEVAADNVRLNGVAQRVRVVHAAGLSDPTTRVKRFNLAIANILAGPLIRLAPQLSRSVKPEGVLVLSGILNAQAAEVLATYLAHGFTTNRHDRITGWSTLTLLRR